LIKGDEGRGLPGAADGIKRLAETLFASEQRAQNGSSAVARTGSTEKALDHQPQSPGVQRDSAKASADSCFDCPLTDEQVKQAISRGHGKNAPQRVSLIEWDKALNGPVSGFTVYIYTPARWIEYQAWLAASDLKNFTIADVNADMRANVLHIVVLPSEAEKLTGPGMVQAQGVKRVILRDTAQRLQLEALQSTDSTVTDSSALRDVSYNAVTAVFPMGRVLELRKMDKKGEFLIIVIGEKSNTMFKMKQRHIKYLGY
jgi:hypothetical protein